MADNNRSRLLLLLKYLQKNTDDEHVASVADITAMLEQKGINGNRNTIRDDVKALNDAGYEILANVGPSNSKLYHYGARPFDEPELKLLIDAVSSSQFIGVKQSQDLIDKICELTSKYEAEKLVARVYTSERIKTENSKLLYVVDMINEARVILIDEFEKCDKQVQNFFLQLLEDGIFTDSLGRDYDLDKYIIIFTANLPAEDVSKKLSRELISRFNLKYSLSKLTEEEKKLYVKKRATSIVEDVYTKFGLNIKTETETVIEQIDVANYDNMRDINNIIMNKISELLYPHIYK